MTKLEQYRQTWQGKSDEWLFERLALELTQKVEEIHKLLAENEQLRLHSVVGRSEQLTCPRCKSTNILNPDKDNDTQCIECAFVWAG